MTNTEISTKSNESPEEKEVGLLFLANFVHQVVNPLNGVIGTLDNINDGTYQGPIIKQKVNACRGQLEQCVTLIRNLAYLSDFFFDVSEKEDLKTVREDATSILPQVIIEALQFFQIAAEKREIKIELIEPIAQYRIKARHELLKQVFINIFDNWLKYGLRSQTINITTSVNRKKDLVIDIIGTSIGFHNADAERIFEMGFRSKEAHNKVAQGSGIGLFICRQITTKVLEGQITASHSAKTSKTSFHISIPKKKWLL